MNKEPLAVQLGQNIRALRKEAGMTQEELAAEIHVQNSYISRIEWGEKLVSLKVLQAFSEIFGVSYDTILRDSDNNNRMQNIQHLLAGRSEEYLAWIEKVLRACAKHPAI